jgi:hypothetical protein
MAQISRGLYLPDFGKCGAVAGSPSGLPLAGWDFRWKWLISQWVPHPFPSFGKGWDTGCAGAAALRQIYISRFYFLPVPAVTHFLIRALPAIRSLAIA